MINDIDFILSKYENHNNGDFGRGIPNGTLTYGNAKKAILEYLKWNPSIVQTIEKEYKRKEAKGWDKVYLFLDLHETVIYPDYSNIEPIRFYEHAKKCLQFLSTIKEVELGFYTCSYPEEIEKYKKHFEELGIKIIHINKNEDVSDTRYGYYKDKPYFSLVFENKAGFSGENDWLPVLNWFKEYYKDKK